MLRDWLAPDGFRGQDGILGGDLVDTGTPFAGRDKVQHLIIGALWVLLLARWTRLGALACLGLVLVFAVAWELLEVLRYRRWVRSLDAGATTPWPLAADRLSWRDILATLAGAVLAECLL